MPTSILGRLRDLLGGPAVGIDAQGVPRAMPDTIEGAALVLGAAYDEGWRVRVEGQGTWMSPDADADLALGTRGLDRVLEVDSERALVRAEAGVSLDELRRAIGDDGLWLPLDPPGRPERTLGSVVATATAGPLRTWGGSVRELVVGAGVLTGAGRLVASPANGDGPRELPRLAAGSFGAAGVVAWAELRLEPVPRMDRTFLARAPRDRLTEAGRALVEAGVGPAAAEILSPAWGADESQAVAAVDWSRGIATRRGRHIVLFEAGAGGRFGGEEAENVLAGARVRHFFSNFGRHQLVSSARFDAARNLDAENQLLLGGDNGLRGYFVSIGSITPCGNDGAEPTSAMVLRVMARLAAATSAR